VLWGEEHETEASHGKCSLNARARNTESVTFTCDPQIRCPRDSSRSLPSCLPPVEFASHIEPVELHPMLHKIPSQFDESKHLDCSIDPKVPRDSCHYAPISILRKPMHMEGQCECVQTQSTKPIAATPIASIFHIHQVASRLFVLLLARTLDLCRTSESLLSVLALLA